jgi:hypothetical protein
MDGEHFRVGAEPIGQQNEIDIVALQVNPVNARAPAILVVKPTLTADSGSDVLSGAIISVSTVIILRKQHGLCQ